MSSTEGAIDGAGWWSSSESRLMSDCRRGDAAGNSRPRNTRMRSPISSQIARQCVLSSCSCFWALIGFFPHDFLQGQYESNSKRSNAIPAAFECKRLRGINHVPGAVPDLTGVPRPMKMESLGPFRCPCDHHTAAREAHIARLACAGVAGKAAKHPDAADSANGAPGRMKPGTAR